jgi:serine phosphatase RsbU (regulator of sigma subunit)
MEKKWRQKLSVAAVIFIAALSISFALFSILSTKHQDGVYPLKADDVWAYVDQSDTLTASEILVFPDSLFTLFEGATPNFGFCRGSVWIITSIPQEARQNPNAIFEIKNPILNKVEVYEKTDNGLKLLLFAGDDEKFDARKRDHRNYLISLSEMNNSNNQLIIRVSSSGEQLLLPLMVWDEASLDQRDYDDMLIRGSYFGLVIFVLLFNLFVYFVVKEESSLYYLLYNLSLLFLQFSLGGLAFQYLWPNSPYLANALNPFFASIAIYALLRFSQKFLNLEVYFPRLNKVFFYIALVLLVNAFLALFYIRPLFDATILVVNCFTFLLSFAIIPVAYLVRKKKFAPAKFFLLAFVILVVTVIIFLFTNFGILQNDFFAEYGLLIGSALEVILLSFAIVDRFKSFKDDAFSRLQEINRITAENNEQLERKVEERTVEIERQKEEILSSIRYAERIQKSLLPTDAQLRDLFPEAFVYFRPKDIVSGDFYWIGKKNMPHVNGEMEEWMVFATADCTGHGVPGAFMSVMGINVMEQTLMNEEVETPGQALDFLNRKICENIQGKNNETGLRDGMDIMLGAISPSKMKLYYAGANQKFIIQRMGELIELDGDKRPIGSMEFAQPFSNYEFDLQRGDIIYSYTDGYKDQFGGPNAKKFKITGLKTLIQELAPLTMAEQRDRVADTFEKWKGPLEQIDDVCVMAIRI